MSEPTTNLKDGDRRNVTVLFTDMVGFTALSESLDPEEVDSIMNTLFSRFEAIVARHDGTVEKYIGDAMVAAFGVPRIHEDDAVRAVHAALDFQDASNAVFKRFSKKIDIKFRTGIHTGLITTGKRGDFDVITGNTMNIAARLQQTAEAGAILVSQSTIEECGNDFLLGPPLALALKGRSDPIMAYEVKQRNPHTMVAEPHFIARKNLLEEMLSLWLRHDSTKTGGVLLTGGAGIGKTALAVKCIDSIRRFPDFRQPILHARARRFRTMPFAVITDLISNAAGIDGRSNGIDLAEILSERLDIGEESSKDLASLIQDGNNSRFDTGTIFALLNTILRQVLDQGKNLPYNPILFIDNSNFVDKQSLDFLSWYIKKASRKPWVILAEREPRTEIDNAIPGLLSRELPPLTHDESMSLLNGLLGDQAFDGERLEGILHSAEGIPLFIHAYARFLRTERNLPKDQQTEIPSSIQNVFLTNIASYNDDIRDFLKKISVFVQNFSLEDAMFIQSKTDGDPTLVPATLSFFEQEEILYRDQDEAYYFRHDIFKKALYNSLLNYNKKLLHQLVVKIMSRQSQPHTQRLVHHMIKGELYEEAARVMTDAFVSIKDLEFRQYYDTLLELENTLDSETQMTMLYRKAALLFNNGRVEEADSILKILLRRSFESTKKTWAASSYHLLCAYNAQSFRFQKARFCGKKALSFYQADSERTKIANVHEILLMNSTFAGDNTEQQVHLEQLTILAKDHAQALHRLITAKIELASIKGDYGQALAYLEDAKQLQDHELSNQLLTTAWRLYRNCGNIELARQSVDTYLATDSWNAESAMASAGRGAIAFLQGDPRAKEFLDEGEFRFLDRINDFERLELLRELALTWYCMEDWDSIGKHVMDGIIIGQRHSAYFPTFTLLMVWTQYLLHLERKVQAQFFIEEAESIVSMGVLVCPQDKIMYHWARFLIDGRDSETKEAWTILNKLLSEPGIQRGTFLKQRHFEALYFAQPFMKTKN